MADIIALVKYVAYVARHKRYVLLAGLRIGTPLWRLIAHDVSKLFPDEIMAYTQHFYGDGRPLGTAWLRHIHRNDHHWQYWVLRNDDGTVVALKMSQAATYEMVADWMGMSDMLGGDVRDWYSHSKMLLHPDTRAAVELLTGAREECQIETAPRGAEENKCE
jgi:hypothetical protein